MEQEREPTLPTSCPIPSPRERTMLLKLWGLCSLLFFFAWGVLSQLCPFAHLQVYFLRTPLRGPSPTPVQLIFSSEDKALLDPKIEIKGGGQTVGAWKGAKELQEVALEKLQGNL